MPSIEYDDSKPSWADQVEEEGDEGTLPSPKETIKGNIKTVTEYKIDEDDGKKYKIVRTFKIETRKASKAVARRKNWKKFGNSERDPPGPNVATTTVSDDVFMTFISSKDVRICCICLSLSLHILRFHFCTRNPAIVRLHVDK
ncbi:Eukaryotic translation initiation factor 3 subunit G [Xenotaenia resolanae]|uniref:Eukaryotic translation initiation factor 3 subunit G n=1 Tax=Xenotaenia resolanae TaxID=208358 RepID=A0ABV0WFN8_9TELE